MAISSPGIGSNIDVNGIVGQLMAVERRPLATLDRREASFQAQLTAYGTLRGALSTLKGAADALDDPARFRTASFGSSDSAVLAGSASAGAVRGSYSVEVSQLAQRQSLVAAGQVSQNAAIGAGGTTTITLQLGTISGGTLANGTYSGATFTPDPASSAKTITIGPGANTLAGIRDAINQANAGVTASIVRDGSSAPYRLVLQSAATGAAGSMRLSVSGDAAIGNLLGQDPAGVQNLSQTAAAQDAQLTVNGVQASSRSNTVSDVLDGVSLTLLKTGAATATVGNATSAVTQSVQDLVKAYNDFNRTIADLSRADPTGQRSGVLVGDSGARTLQAQLRSVFGGSLPGTREGELRTLGQVGLSFQRDGSLSLDTGKLQSALAEDPDAVARLFASGAKASDAQLRVVATGQKTQPGSYAVNITTLPSQGSLTGSAAATLDITAGVNDTLSVTVDGTTATVTLAPGSYTATSLAAQLQSAVNGTSAFVAAGAAVSVTQSGGVLAMRSLAYGAASSVAATGAGASDLFGPAPAAVGGTDVAGSIGPGASTGSGRQLTAAADGAAAGLVLEVTGGTTGERGNVVFNRGFAWRLNDQLDSILGNEGVLAARSDGINQSIKDIGRQRETLNRRLDAVETRYRAQYTALDSLLSSMQSTSAYLTQQLAALNASRS